MLITTDNDYNDDDVQSERYPLLSELFYVDGVIEGALDAGAAIP